MPTPLGANNARVAHVRALLTHKGRRDQKRFLCEGATLLQEAWDSGIRPQAVFATQSAYERFEIIGQVEAAGIETFIVDERTANRLSDVQSPSGILAVLPWNLREVPSLLEGGGIVLVLADVGDPGNAGTLIRSAEAFGARGIVFGDEAVEPYHPKVVRSAMGSIFRTNVAVATPHEVESAARTADWPIVGLEASGESLATVRFPSHLVLIVGHERRGLGRWGPLCGRTLSIEMAGSAESLNAAVAGSIALYTAARACA